MTNTPDLITIVQAIAQLLTSSARLSPGTLLLDEFLRCKGYTFLCDMVCLSTSTERVDELLSVIESLVYVGDNFEETHVSTAQASASRSTQMLALNSPAFAIVSQLLGKCCEAYVEDSATILVRLAHVPENYNVQQEEEETVFSEDDPMGMSDEDGISASSPSLSVSTSTIANTTTQPINHTTTFPLTTTTPPLRTPNSSFSSTTLKRVVSDSWSMLGEDTHKQVALDADLVRLSVLHTILKIYSAHPSNFEVLDDKFGITTALVTCLGLGGNQAFIHDEFVYMTLKLVEYVCMGIVTLKNKPVFLVSLLGNEVLPLLLDHTHDSSTRNPQVFSSVLQSTITLVRFDAAYQHALLSSPSFLEAVVLPYVSGLHTRLHDAHLVDEFPGIVKLMMELLSFPGTLNLLRQSPLLSLLEEVGKYLYSCVH